MYIYMYTIATTTIVAAHAKLLGLHMAITTDLAYEIFAKCAQLSLRNGIVCICTSRLRGLEIVRADGLVHVEYNVCHNGDTQSPRAITI